MCCGYAEFLLPFVEQILCLEFDETPKYGKLRFTLEKMLLDKNVVPNKQFDWCRDSDLQGVVVRMMSNGSYNSDRMRNVEEIKTNNYEMNQMKPEIQMRGYQFKNPNKKSDKT